LSPDPPTLVVVVIGEPLGVNPLEPSDELRSTSLNGEEELQDSAFLILNCDFKGDLNGDFIIIVPILRENVPPEEVQAVFNTEGGE